MTRNLPAIILALVLALALAFALAAIPFIGVAHSGPSLVAQADAVTHSSERVDAPMPLVVEAPVVDDAEALHRLARPIGVGVLMALLALSLGIAGARVSWLSWLARGTAATVIGAVSACGEAVLEVALAGGSVAAVEMAGIAAVLAFWRARRPTPPGAIVEVPTGPPTRRPEGGLARTSLLVWLATVGLLTAGAGMASCAGTQRAAVTASGVIVDCLQAVAPGELAKAIPLAEAALAYALRPDGSYDTAALLDVARSMSLATAGCALAEAVSRLRPAVNMRLATSPAESRLDAAWRTVQTEQLGGRAFRVASGAVL